MSTKINTMSANLYVKCDRHSDMKSGQENLSDFVRRMIDEKGLSYREVERRAGAAGYEISHATVGDIINKPDKTVQLDTLVALAAGLDVDIEVLTSLASGEGSDLDLNKIIERDMREIARILNGADEKEREYGLRLIETIKYDLRRRIQDVARRQSKVTTHRPIRKKDLIRIPVTMAANANEKQEKEKKAK